MNPNKTAGIALMVAFAGAFIAWSLLAPAAMSGLAHGLVSGGLALGLFLAWRFLVWENPRKKS